MMTIEPLTHLRHNFECMCRGVSDDRFREHALEILQLEAEYYEDAATGARMDGRVEDARASEAEGRRLRAHAGAAEEFQEWPEAFDIAFRVAERWGGTGDELVALVEQILQRLAR